MQQSNVIFAALFIAFIVYITTKGELATYIGFLKGTKSVTTTGTSSSIQAPPSPIANTIEQQAESLLSQSPGIQIPAPHP